MNPSEKDIRAFKMIEHLHLVQRSTLEGLACSYVHDRVAAQDMVSEAFVALITNRDNVEPEKYLDYLHAAVKYRSISLRRMENGHREAHERIERNEKRMMEHWTRTIENSTFSTVMSDEIMRIYREVLDGAPALTRQIFEKSRRDEMTYKEIATELGIPENKVKYEMQKFLGELRHALSDYTELLLLLMLVLTGIGGG